MRRLQPKNKPNTQHIIDLDPFKFSCSCLRLVRWNILFYEVFRTFKDVNYTSEHTYKDLLLQQEIFVAFLCLFLLNLTSI